MVFMRKITSRAKLSFFVFILLSSVVFSSCEDVFYYLSAYWPQSYKVEGDPSDLKAKFSKKDKSREKVDINLALIVKGIKQVTDFKFVPGASHLLFVLQKTGELIAFDLKKKIKVTLIKLDVLTNSEQGLLGIAFHPNFKKNKKLYLNYTIKKGSSDYTEVSEWLFLSNKEIAKSKLKKQKIILQIKQPFANHNGGSIVFGPDKMLYIGLGDGGFANDPHKNGQNSKTLLGSMLRLDVDKKSSDRNYSIPKDNPFVGKADYREEIWALGLRNPWKYSFTPKGKLIVADVGQDKWEEINIIEKGKNYGWNYREGRHCFSPKKNCQKNSVDPIYEYGRDEGASITGGYVYTGNEIKALRGKYLFADFVSGRVWAIDFSQMKNQEVKKVYSLGKWPLLISSFSQDEQGEVYLADFGEGRIFKIIE